jgi:SOS-response transcriptional repressor LexA
MKQVSSKLIASQLELKILIFIKNKLLKEYLPPTIREIQKHFKISSTSVVTYHLRKLERLGYIKRIKGLSRGIKYLDHKSPLPSELYHSKQVAKNSSTRRSLEKVQVK